MMFMLFFWSVVFLAEFWGFFERKYAKYVIHRFQIHLPEVFTQGKPPKKSLSAHDS